MRTVYYITLPITYLCIGFVYLYKITLSKLLPDNCRYVPTCSTYMIQALKEWGLFYGLYLGTRRILRCRSPYGGEDWIPLNPKGDKKWIF